MDTPPPAAVDDRELLDRLVSGWDLRIDDLRYQPKGAGSYHWMATAQGRPRCFVTVDDLDTKPWIALARDPTFEGLTAAYEAAWRLQHAVGLPFVVGPLRNDDGAVIVRLSDQHTMTVFPFVGGAAGEWGDLLLDEARSALLHDLAQLHQVGAEADLPLRHRDLDLAERPLLVAAMQDLDQPWHGGPLAEPARHALADHAEAVAAWLAELDELARQVRLEGGEPVLTHGEPHPGNLIHTGDDFRLIDWDTIAVAAPERDLWMLDDGALGGFGHYETSLGRPVSEAAIRFYRLAWTLSDLAYFTDMFRSPHEHTRWVDLKWRGYQRLLGGAASEPYGRR